MRKKCKSMRKTSKKTMRKYEKSEDVIPELVPEKSKKGKGLFASMLD